MSSRRTAFDLYIRYSKEIKTKSGKAAYKRTKWNSLARLWLLFLSKLEMTELRIKISFCNPV